MPEAPSLTNLWTSHPKVDGQNALSVLSDRQLKVDFAEKFHLSEPKTQNPLGLGPDRKLQAKVSEASRFARSERQSETLRLCRNNPRRFYFRAIREGGIRMLLAGYRGYTVV